MKKRSAADIKAMLSDARAGCSLPLIAKRNGIALRTAQTMLKEAGIVLHHSNSALNPVEPTATKTVITRSAVTKDGGQVHLRISLPRIKMHLATLEERAMSDQIGGAAIECEEISR